MEGLLSTGPTPSDAYQFLPLMCTLYTDKNKDTVNTELTTAHCTLHTAGNDYLALESREGSLILVWEYKKYSCEKLLKRAEFIAQYAECTGCCVECRKQISV